MLTTLQPTAQTYAIEYPTLMLEFEVQAWLWAELRRRGYDARAEVQHLGSFGLRAAKAACRFDIVVFDGRAAKCIIEVKARPVTHKSTVSATRQGTRYVQFGVPTHFVYGMAGARDLLLQFMGL